MDAIKGTEAGITQFLEFAEVSEVNVEILTHPEISFEDIVQTFSWLIKNSFFLVILDFVRSVRLKYFFLTCL